MDEETIRRAVDVALKTLCGKSPVLFMEAQGGEGRYYPEIHNLCLYFIPQDKVCWPGHVMSR